MKTIARVLLFAVIIGVLGMAYYFIRRGGNTRRDLSVMQWIRSAQDHPEWAMHSGQRCADAPFQFPTDGFVGYLWGDSFRPGHHHQGIDIFGGDEPGITPIYAAYAGYLTREVDWKSSVILRLPEDPLSPNRQVWTYYTHMADAQGNSYIDDQFPPGTKEMFVEAGTLLGRQGNFSGTPGSPVGVHLHFSVVLSKADGGYKNELDINNTLDPSAYFQLPLNAKTNPGVVPLCPPPAGGEIGGR